MLVVIQGGIDLSTPGVMAAAGNLVAGIGAGSDHKLPVAILAALGVGVFVGLVNGVLVGVLRLNPLIVTLAVGLIVLAWSSKYSRDVVTNRPNVPNGLSSWATAKPLGVSSVFWTGAAITVLVALVLRYTVVGRRFQAVGANPRGAWMAGLRVRTYVVLAYTAAGTLYAVRSGAARGRELQHRPGLRLGVPARADRSGGDRRRIALGRARERDVHLDRRVRPHPADADAPDHGALVGDAVHRLRHRDHRGNGRLG